MKTSRHACSATYGCSAARFFASWLAAAYGTSNEIVLEYDKETREWVNRHFPRDPHEPVS